MTAWELAVLTDLAIREARMRLILRGVGDKSMTIITISAIFCHKPDTRTIYSARCKCFFVSSLYGD